MKIKAVSTIPTRREITVEVSPKMKIREVLNHICSLLDEELCTQGDFLVVLTVADRAFQLSETDFDSELDAFVANHIDTGEVKLLIVPILEGG